MIDGMVTERPILGLRAAVDAMGSVDASEFTDARLAGEIRCVRREMDRMEAVFSGLVAAGHRRGVGALEGFQSTNAWLRARSGMRAGEVSELLPETGSAWRDGEISSGAMHMIVKARVPGYDTEFQACEPELLKAARRSDLWSLSRLAAQIRLLARSEGNEPTSEDGLRSSVVGDRLVLDGELEGSRPRRSSARSKHSPTRPLRTTIERRPNAAPTDWFVCVGLHSMLASTRTRRV